ncbi:fungal hydrophobin [Mycena amicta]|nr:fungal hydrophobin [Mycena amicta]KAJ7063906.1 fungal hydrophobin [Mycena amicta]
MFNKFVALFALFTLAAAAPSPRADGQQCCASVISSNDPAAAAAANSLVGVVLAGLNVPVGLSCSPITVIGNNCGGTTVTCESPVGQFGGVISINCIPITL